MRQDAGVARVGESRWKGFDWVREKIATVREFYVETRLEMKRVTWPTRMQVQSTTLVVIVTVFFFGAYFMIADNIVGRLIDFVFKKLRG